MRVYALGLSDFGLYRLRSFEFRVKRLWFLAFEGLETKGA